MSAQTVTTIAHLFSICIRSPSVDTHFRWRSVCFREMWDRLDVLLSSTLSSKKVTVKKKTVPTSSGAMLDRVLVGPRFLPVIIIIFFVLFSLI